LRTERSGEQSNEQEGYEMIIHIDEFDFLQDASKFDIFTLVSEFKKSAGSYSVIFRKKPKLHYEKVLTQFADTTCVLKGAISMFRPCSTEELKTLWSNKYELIEEMKAKVYATKQKSN